MDSDNIVDTGHRLLTNVREEHTFSVVNGTTLRNIHELVLLLETIEQHEFQHHVLDDRNDFASWIRHCVQDTTLASRIEKAKTPSEAQAVILERLDEIEKEISRSVDSAQKARKPGKKQSSKSAAVQDERKDLDYDHDAVLKEIERALQEAHEKFPDEPAPKSKGKFSLGDFLAGFVFGIILGVLLSTGFVMLFM